MGTGAACRTAQDPRIQERDRGVLHVTREVHLRVDVADLLQLECTSLDDRVVDPSPQADHGMRLGEQIGHHFAEAVGLIQKAS